MWNDFCYLYSIRTLRTYFAYLTLAIMLTVMVPTSSWHELFADHHDTECVAFGETTLEAPHTHCDVFSTNSPVYLPVEVIAHLHLLQEICCVVNTPEATLLSNTPIALLAARGPPTSC